MGEQYIRVILIKQQLTYYANEKKRNENETKRNKTKQTIQTKQQRLEEKTIIKK